MRKFSHERVDEDFRKEIMEIMGEHLKKGKKLSFKRITKAIPRTSVWKDMKDILKNSEIKDDKS